MSRDKFLKALQYFDRHYNAVRFENDEALIHELDERIQICKEDKTNEALHELCTAHRNELHELGVLKFVYVADDNFDFMQLYSRVNIKLVRHITVNNDNCFTPFYGLDDSDLFALFELLSVTELALTNYTDFSSKYRDRKQQNRNEALQNKMNDILDYAKEVSAHAETEKYNQYDDVQDLERIFNRLTEALHNKHYTERQVFQNLLWGVSHILSSDGVYKVAKITNAIIGQYFDVDINFSRNEDTTKYTRTTYYYADSAGITLSHS